MIMMIKIMRKIKVILKNIYYNKQKTSIIRINKTLITDKTLTREERKINTYLFKR